MNKNTFNNRYNCINIKQKNEIVEVEVINNSNIITNEFGNAIGLGYVYDYACSKITMCGFSDYEEVEKRTLEKPDINVLKTLYVS